jgi:voltage-gated potassium channel
VPVAPGQPKTEADAQALAKYEHRARVPIILAALLPLVLAPEPGHWIDEVIDVVSWLVFVVDFVVHRRRLSVYLSTRLGKFDLAVVVLTAPWFLLPGAQAGGFVVILRLARLVRLLFASRGARQLFERLGRVVVVAGGIVLVGASVAYYAEHATNPGFKTYRDSLWWAIVTLTTVGYGDIVPQTSTGRWAAVMVMLTGVAVLGLLAGSLASFFRLDSGSEASTPGETSPADPSPAAIMSELSALRTQVSALTELVAQSRADPPDGPNPR